MDKNELNEKISKLPLWAKQHITKLERNLEFLQNLFNQDNKETNVFTESYSYGKKYLPDGFAVKFKLKNGAEIAVLYGEDCIEVSSSGAEALTVAPRVTNVVRIKASREML